MKPKPITQKKYEERMAKLERALYREKRILMKHEDGFQDFSMDRDEAQFTEGVAVGLAKAIEILKGR